MRRFWYIIRACLCCGLVGWRAACDNWRGKLTTVCACLGCF
jgi:hypothetical protein